jgi:hypothetical protein
MKPLIWAFAAVARAASARLNMRGITSAANKRDDGEPPPSFQ